jgi:hypothetical protein
MLTLKTLLVPSKTTEAEYPGLEGFKVQIAFLSRETLTGIRKKAVKVTYKNRMPVEELDDKLFMKLYTEAVIKGWKGLKLSYLEQLVPVDISEEDPDAEFPYSPEEALQLMQGSVAFESFVTEVANDLSNFSTAKEKK